MAELLAQLEQSSLATWMLESSSLFAYPLILFLHTLGMTLLVGLNAVIALRLLGMAPFIPLAPIRKAFTLMWFGFGLNVATGTLLFIADATKHFKNPAFFVKLTLVALGMSSLALIKKRVFDDPLIDKGPVQFPGRVLALTSLFLWIGTITAGRLMAYIAEFLVGV